MEETFTVKSHIQEHPGRVNIDEWNQTLINGAKKAFVELKMVPPSLFIFSINPAKPDDSLIHIISMQQLPSTASVPDVVKHIAQEVKVYGVATVSEAWSLHTKDKILAENHGELAKRDDKQEIVLISLETKHRKRCTMIDIVRDAQGNPSCGEINQETNIEGSVKIEGRLVDILYDEEASKSLS